VAASWLKVLGERREDRTKYATREMTGMFLPNGCALMTFYLMTF
jgi:hypothetical protein